MGNGPQARLPGRLCSFSDMGRMPLSERAPPSSGTAALRIFPSPASKNPCGKRAKPAKPQPGGQSASQPPSHREGTALERHGGPHAPFFLPPGKPLRQAGKARKAAAGRPTARPPQPQPGGHRPRYASTTISSFVSRAVCTSSSIFSSRFFSCLRITFRFGLVTGCFATKMVQQSSKGRIEVS